MSEIYKLCGQFKQVFYLIRLKQNIVLLTQTEQLVVEDTEGTDFITASTQYFFMDYRAGRWNKTRTVAVKAIRPTGSLVYTHFEFIVTNLQDLSAKEVFKAYQGRGTMENYIKEIKHIFTLIKQTVLSL